MNILSKIIPAFLLISLTVLLSECIGAEPVKQAATQITPDSTASLAKAIVKVAGALTLVVGLMVITMKVIRKLGMGRSDLAAGSIISILDTKMIAPKKYVAVLRVADELLAVGVTDQQISLLSNIKNGEDIMSLETENRAASSFSFPDILDKAKDSIKGIKNQH